MPPEFMGQNICSRCEGYGKTIHRDPCPSCGGTGESIRGVICEHCGTLWPDDADDMPDFEPCYCDLGPTPATARKQEP